MSRLGYSEELQSAFALRWRGLILATVVTAGHLMLTGILLFGPRGWDEVLAKIHGLSNFKIIPWNGDEELWLLVVFGWCCTQAFVLGMWAGLGPGSALLRAMIAAILCLAEGLRSP